MREFYGCYLLHSKHPQTRDRTYIGFTVNPRRRIRQHNGAIGAGAYKTKKWRPWEMQLVVYGFPTQVQALQFEWAWQHPEKSKAVRDFAKRLGKRGMTGVKGKVHLMLGMLSLAPWCFYPLTLQYLTSAAADKASGLLKPPPHVKVLVAPMDDLPTAIHDDDNDEDGNNHGNAGDGGEDDYDGEDVMMTQMDSMLTGSQVDGGSDDEDGDEGEAVDLPAGMTPEQAAPPNGKTWMCDVCGGAIERHVLHCDCRSGYHVHCLASLWTLQNNYDPLSDTSPPKLPGLRDSIMKMTQMSQGQQAVQAAAEPGKKRRSHKKAADEDAQVASGSDGGAGQGPVKGKATKRRRKAGADIAPQHVVLEALPEEGCCPNCGKQHRWLDLLSNMLPYGYAVKPRNRRRRRQLKPLKADSSLKATGSKLAKSDTQPGRGRGRKKGAEDGVTSGTRARQGRGASSSRSTSREGISSPKRGKKLTSIDEEVDMADLPTPKSSKRAVRRRKTTAAADTGIDIDAGLPDSDLVLAVGSTKERRKGAKKLVAPSPKRKTQKRTGNKASGSAAVPEAVFTSDTDSFGMNSNPSTPLSGRKRPSPKATKQMTDEEYAALPLAERLRLRTQASLNIESLLGGGGTSSQRLATASQSAAAAAASAAVGKPPKAPRGATKAKQKATGLTLQVGSSAQDKGAGSDSDAGAKKPAKGRRKTALARVDVTEGIPIGGSYAAADDSEHELISPTKTRRKRVIATSSDDEKIGIVANTAPQDLPDAAEKKRGNGKRATKAKHTAVAELQSLPTFSSNSEGSGRGGVAAKHTQQALQQACHRDDMEAILVSSDDSVVSSTRKRRKAPGSSAVDKATRSNNVPVIEIEETPAAVKRRARTTTTKVKSEHNSDSVSVVSLASDGSQDVSNTQSSPSLTSAVKVRRRGVPVRLTQQHGAPAPLPTASNDMNNPAPADATPGAMEAIQRPSLPQPSSPQLQQLAALPEQAAAAPASTPAMLPLAERLRRRAAGVAHPGVAGIQVRLDAWQQISASLLQRDEGVLSPQPSTSYHDDHVMAQVPPPQMTMVLLDGLAEQQQSTMHGHDVDCADGPGIHITSPTRFMTASPALDDELQVHAVGQPCDMLMQTGCEAVEAIVQEPDHDNNGMHVCSVEHGPRNDAAANVTSNDADAWTPTTAAVLSGVFPVQADSPLQHSPSSSHVTGDTNQQIPHEEADMPNTQDWATTRGEPAAGGKLQAADIECPQRQSPITLQSNLEQGQCTANLQTGTSRHQESKHAAATEDAMGLTGMGSPSGQQLPGEMKHETAAQVMEGGVTSPPSCSLHNAQMACGSTPLPVKAHLSTSMQLHESTMVSSMQALCGSQVCVPNMEKQCTIQTVCASPSLGPSHDDYSDGHNHAEPTVDGQRIPQGSVVEYEDDMNAAVPLQVPLMGPRQQEPVGVTQATHQCDEHISLPSVPVLDVAVSDKAVTAPSSPCCNIVVGAVTGYACEGLLEESTLPQPQPHVMSSQPDWPEAANAGHAPCLQPNSAHVASAAADATTPADGLCVHDTVGGGTGGCAPVVTDTLNSVVHDHPIQPQPPVPGFVASQQDPTQGPYSSSDGIYTRQKGSQQQSFQHAKPKQRQVMCIEDEDVEPAAAIGLGSQPGMKSSKPAKSKRCAKPLTELHLSQSAPTGPLQGQAARKTTNMVHTAHVLSGKSCEQQQVQQDVSATGAAGVGLPSQPPVLVTTAAPRRHPRRGMEVVMLVSDEEVGHAE